MLKKTITAKSLLAISYSIAGHGPAIMLLHGFPASGIIWHTVAKALSENYTVIIPDLPGSGGSTGTPDLNMSKMASAMIDVLDNENITKAVIAGHSMGGYVALEMAAQFPERISGIAMIHSIATEDTEEKKQQRRKAIALIEKGGKEAFVKQMIPTLFSEHSIKNRPELVHEMLAEGLKMSSDSLIAFYNAMINRQNRLETLQDADFPVFWVAGAADNLIPQEKIMQQSIQSSVNFVYIYHHSGHVAMLEEPERLINDIRSFITYTYARKMI